MQPLRAILVTAVLFNVGCSNVKPIPIEVDVTFLQTPVLVPETRPIVAIDLAPDTSDVWNVLRQGMALEHATEQPSVARAVADYLRGAGLMYALQPRAQRYFAYVVEEVKQRNLPMELALLPIIESTLNPYAYSQSGAAGLWQMIPTTARDQGVTIDWWYDGRRDLLDSTTAALDYLTYLYGQFGDWVLAIAAYNGGEGRVRRALRKSPGADFFDLELPRETQGYVPQVLALAYLIAQDDSFTLPPLTTEPPFFVTTIDAQIDMEKLAFDSDMSIDELFNLNPGLNRRTTPPNRNFRLLIPESKREAYEAAIGQLPADSTRWERHRVTQGESLSVIAHRHQTTVSAIRSSNGLTGNLIRANQVLLIPSAPVDPGALAVNPMLMRTHRMRRHTVKSGESLWGIARRYNTSVAMLSRTNDLNASATLRIGQRLSVPGQDSPMRVVYTVRKGDSLSRIAHTYKVSVAQIAQWNNMNQSALLKPGRQLVLHIPGGAA